MNIKRILICLSLCFVLVLSGCSTAAKPPSTQNAQSPSTTSAAHTKFNYYFFDTFDTLITLIGYAPTQESFDQSAQMVHERFITLHQIFDSYNAYEGVNNVYLLNAKAAEAPIEVDPILFDLLQLCKEKQPTSNGKVNVAMGSVLSIWHDYRDAGLENPETAALPPMDLLTAAASHMSFDDVVLDEQNHTVYFSDPSIRLDLGAVAKGYATELVSQELTASGMTSFIISAGGNVRAGEPPLDGRSAWGIGVQNPEGQVLSSADGDIVETLFLSDMSVVTSGVYQRYYTVDGARYHHLIDPDTLMPSRYFESVTIITKDSGMADFYSTAVFLMPTEEGKAYVDALDGVEALWVLNDGTVQMTDGAKAYAKSEGATAN